MPGCGNSVLSVVLPGDNTCYQDKQSVHPQITVMLLFKPAAECYFRRVHLMALPQSLSLSDSKHCVMPLKYNYYNASHLF